MEKKYSEQELRNALMTVIDPELGFSVVDLGLIYKIEQQDEQILVEFTLTSPGCPLGEIIEADIVETLKKATGLSIIKTEVVWEPYWTPDMASDEIRLMLGYPIW